MRTTIQPFQKEHLDAAGKLLAARQRRDRGSEPTLPALFTEAQEARKAVENVWCKTRARGVVALEQGRVVGFLLAFLKIDTEQGRSAWFPLAGHALEDGVDADLYRDLYATLAPDLLKEGCFNHSVLVPAWDNTALEAWFALSFGKEQAHAIREIRPLPANHLEDTGAGLEIVRATLTDLQEVLEIADITRRYQTGSPIFNAFMPETPDEWLMTYTLLLSYDQASIWLARESGRTVGFWLFMPAAQDVDNLFTPEHCIKSEIGGIRKDARGGGEWLALFAHGLAWARSQGYTYCEIDWRVTNLFASRIWPRRGFRPVAYRLSRRIDERIAWAYTEE